MMKIEDMADLIAMYDTQASADKIICLATGEDTISALEYAGSGLFGNYMKLEKMIERNCCDRIRNASIRDGIPFGRKWLLLSGYKRQTKYRLSSWQIWHDERGISYGE